MSQVDLHMSNCTASPLLSEEAVALTNRQRVHVSPGQIWK